MGHALMSNGFRELYFWCPDKLGRCGFCTKQGPVPAPTCGVDDGVIFHCGHGGRKEEFVCPDFDLRAQECHIFQPILRDS